VSIADINQSVLYGQCDTRLTVTFLALRHITRSLVPNYTTR